MTTQYIVIDNTRPEGKRCSRVVVTGTREPLNGVARFTVVHEFGEVAVPLHDTEWIDWTQAFPLLTGYTGDVVETEALLRGALREAS